MSVTDSETVSREVEIDVGCGMVWGEGSIRQLWFGFLAVFVCNRR